jgi:hypothetical protein
MSGADTDAILEVPDNAASEAPDAVNASLDGRAPDAIGEPLARTRATEIESSYARGARRISVRARGGNFRSAQGAATP